MEAKDDMGMIYRLGAVLNDNIIINPEEQDVEPQAPLIHDKVEKGSDGAELRSDVDPSGQTYSDGSSSTTRNPDANKLPRQTNWTGKILRDMAHTLGVEPNQRLTDLAPNVYD